MPIQEISLGIVANDDEGSPLREGGEKINQNFTDPLNAASYEVGALAGEIPTNANLSASIAGTATFIGDVYTFSPTGTGFRPLQAGMYLSFKLPSGSSNTTTTPDINYNGALYVIKFINSSALGASDLSEQFNKQPILFYFNGTDMLIASDISGSNANGSWTIRVDGGLECKGSLPTGSATGWTNAATHSFINAGGKVFPKTFSTVPSLTALTSEGEISARSAYLTSIGRSTSGVTSCYYCSPAASTGFGTAINGEYTAKGRWY